MSIYVKDPVREASAQIWIQFPRDVVPSFMHSCRHTRKFVFSRLLDQLWLFCLAGYLVPSLPVGMLLWHEILGHTGNHPQINSPTSPLPPARHHMSCCEIWRRLIRCVFFADFFHASEVEECQNSNWPNIILRPECQCMHRWGASACYFQRPTLFWVISSLVWLDLKFDDVTVWIATWPLWQKHNGIHKWTLQLKEGLLALATWLACLFFRVLSNFREKSWRFTELHSQKWINSQKNTWINHMKSCISGGLHCYFHTHPKDLSIWQVFYYPACHRTALQRPGVVLCDWITSHQNEVYRFRSMFPVDLTVIWSVFFQRWGNVRAFIQLDVSQYLLSDLFAERNVARASSLCWASVFLKVGGEYLDIH